jgi:hypothetical protein
LICRPRRDVVACATDSPSTAAMGHIFCNEYFRLLDSGETVDVLAIGDSWFHYPFNNLITALYEALERPTIFVIGENVRARTSWLQARGSPTWGRLSVDPAGMHQRGGQ